MESPRPNGRKIGHYQLVEELGRGAQGSVYLAEDTRLSRKVALKVLSGAFAPSKATILRFQREAGAASKLDHPGICSVYEAGEADGHHFIAMRYVEGQTLARQIASTRATQASQGSETVLVDLPPDGVKAAPVPPPAAGAGPSTRAKITQVVSLIEHTARALHAAHEAGLIHRDVKPGNIMVTREEKAVILDFGLARDEDNDLQTLTHSGDLLGTPAYMSPEQLLAHRIPLDRRTDIYSLGVTLFECLTLHRPHEAPTRDGIYQKILAGDVVDPTRLNPSISKDLRVVIQTAMEKDRERRYKTALDFAEDLRRVRSYEPILARPAGPALRFRRWTQRNPVLATATLGLILLLSTGLAISLVLLEQVRRGVEAKDRAYEVAKEKTAAQERALRDLKAESAAKEAALAEKQAALRRAEGLKLTAQASSALSSNPGLALLLAIEASSRELGLGLNDVLIETLKAHREMRVIRCQQALGGLVFFSPDGRRVLTATTTTDEWRVWDSGTGRLVTMLGAFKESLSKAVFSPRGDRVLTITSSWSGVEPRLWDVESGELLFSLRGGHSEAVTSAAFRGDGARIVTASLDGTARTWDAFTGEPIAVMKRHESTIANAAFSPDGTQVLTVAGGTSTPGSYSFNTPYEGETTARIWDADTGEPRYRFRGLRGAVAAAWSPDGSLVAVAARGPGSPVGIRVGDLRTGRLRELRAPSGFATVLAFSPDSRRLLTVSSQSAVPGNAGSRPADPERHVVRVWDVGTGEELLQLKGHSNGINSAAWGPDGASIVTASRDLTARIWDARTGEALLVFRGHTAGVEWAASSGDGTRVFTTSLDGTARVWDAAPRRDFTVLPITLEDVPSQAVFSPDGRRFLTLFKNQVVVWEAASGTKLGVIQSGEKKPGLISRMVGGEAGMTFKAAGFAPDSRRIFTLLGDSMQVWEDDGKRLLSTWRPPTPALWLPDLLPTFNPSGQRFLTGHTFNEIVQLKLALDSTSKGIPAGRQHEAVIWDVGTGKRLLRLPGHQDGIRGGSFSLSGERVLTVASNGEAYIWDAESGARVSTLAVDEKLLTAVLSPDGRSAVAIYGGPTATIHDAATGQRLASLTGHTDYLSAVVFSPDSQRILTVSEDHTARMWSSLTGEEIFALTGHVAPVSLGSFSHDGSRVLTASLDQSVRVWDAVSGKELMTLPHPEAIQSMAFTEDQRGVATISGAAEGRIWPLNLLPQARRRMSREITPEEMERFEIGTPEERLARRRQGELNALFEEIDVAAARFRSRKRPVAGGLESLSAKLERLLRDERGDARLEKAIASLESAVERTGRRDPGLLGLLASCEALRGNVWKAVVTLEETLDIPGSDPGLTLALERHRKALRPDLVSFASIDAALDEPEIVIPKGAEWKFFRGRAEPSRALEWTAPGFDDAAWEKGPSGLGYEDYDDATLIEDMKGAYTTLYVRHAFEVSDPARFEAFRLSIIVDDGCVAYLNGAEVARLRAGRTEGRIPFDGTSDKSPDEPVTAKDWTLGPELLVNGRNVLAIQVVNRSIFSSDLSIIPILRGVRRSGPEEDLRRLESFRTVAKGDDAPLRVLHFEGRILERAGKHGAAAAKLEEVLRARPETPEPLLQSARNLRSADDPGAAAARLREGIQDGLKQSAAIWDLWFLLTFGELKADFEAVKAAWPLPRQGKLHPRGEDLRWVIDQLATRKALRMRCGSKEYRSRSGTVWSPDRFSTGGMLSSSTLPIKGTDDDALYQSERWFPREEDVLPGYHVPLPPGRYRVTLHFAEVVYRSGRRRFHIHIEGVQAARDYEPQRAGFASADSKTFETTVKDGVLDIELYRVDGNPKVSAMEIEHLGRE